MVFATAERDNDPAKIVADQKLFENENRAGVRLQAALCALDLLIPTEAATRAGPEEAFNAEL